MQPNQSGRSGMVDPHDSSESLRREFLRQASMPLPGLRSFLPEQPQSQPASFMSSLNQLQPPVPMAFPAPPLMGLHHQPQYPSLGMSSFGSFVASTGALPLPIASSNAALPQYFRPTLDNSQYGSLASIPTIGDGRDTFLSRSLMSMSSFRAGSMSALGEPLGEDSVSSRAPPPQQLQQRPFPQQENLPENAPPLHLSTINQMPSREIPCSNLPSTTPRGVGDFPTCSSIEQAHSSNTTTVAGATVGQGPLNPEDSREEQAEVVARGTGKEQQEEEGLLAAQQLPSPTTQKIPNSLEDGKSAKRKPRKAKSKDDTTDGKPGKSAGQSRRLKDDRWLLMYEQLKEFKKENGHCLVPRGYHTNTRLASWVAEQRKQHRWYLANKTSCMSTERVELLNQVDFVWNAQAAAWNKHVESLKAFKEKYGHCNVPLHDKEFPKLGLWVKEQRRHYIMMKRGRSSHMTTERCAQLNSMNFCWDTHDATWMERYRELKAFKEKFGHCVVPSGWKDNPRLSVWVHHQRRQYNKLIAGRSTHITAERIQRLTEIEFAWKAREGVEPESSVSSRDAVAMAKWQHMKKRESKERARKKSNPTCTNVGGNSEENDDDVSSKSSADSSITDDEDDDDLPLHPSDDDDGDNASLGGTGHSRKLAASVSTASTSRKRNNEANTLIHQKKRMKLEAV